MKYYKLLKDDYVSFKLGTIYPSNSMDKGNWENVDQYAREFPKEWKEVREIDYLLQEAKKNYPKGTEVYPVHWDGELSTTTIIVDPIDFKIISEDSIDAGFMKGFLYRKGTWAKKVENKSVFDETFDFSLENEKEFVLPEKWCVRGIKEMDELRKLKSSDSELFNLINKSKYPFNSDGFGFNNNYYYYPKCNYLIFSGSKPEGYTEITFEQYKQYILKMIDKPYKDTREVTYNMITTHPYFKTLSKEKLKNIIDFMNPEGFSKLEGIYADGKAKILYNKFNEEKMSDKKLIGYKLIKSKFYKAVSVILYGNPSGSTSLNNIIKQEISINKLKEAGVLDIWFEPVYEEQFKVGDWVVFEANRVKKEYPNLWTPFWNKDYVFQIDKIQYSNLYFEGKGSNKGCVSNDIKCFRKATESEIEEAKKKQIPDITINEYKAEFYDNYVKFGCKAYPLDFVNRVNDLLEDNNFDIYDILGSSFKEQIKQIVDYYKRREE